MGQMFVCATNTCTDFVLVEDGKLQPLVDFSEEPSLEDVHAEDLTEFWDSLKRDIFAMDRETIELCMG